jgi:tRNA-Thr(GGU) m(6)t(6)A37 methyltransferase TsaA
MEEIIYKPIGIIHTPFKETKGMPNQPTAGKNVEGIIEIQPEYIEGLDDIEGFSHIILIYHFHFSAGYTLKVKPFMHDRFRGVFATRSPRRPNPIGISVVRLVKVKEGRIYVKDLDIVDGTPLLDIKPYIPDDSRKVERIGWLSERANQVRKKMHRGVPKLNTIRRIKE